MGQTHWRKAKIIVERQLKDAKSNDSPQSVTPAKATTVDDTVQSGGVFPASKPTPINTDFQNTGKASVASHVDSPVIDNPPEDSNKYGNATPSMGSLSSLIPEAT